MTDTTSPSPLVTARPAIDMAGASLRPAGGALDSMGQDQLVERLRDIYLRQGIPITEDALQRDAAAVIESRLTYVAPKAGLSTSLARLYVTRGKWGKGAAIAGLGLVIVLGGYFFGYRPISNQQAEAAQVELTEQLPAQMDALYQTIFEETKVQAAETQAKALQTSGREFVAAGNRAKAQDIVRRLAALRDQLRQDYTVRVVNQPNVSPTFWNIPDNNAEATSYYIVVEAVDDNGNVLSLPIANSDNGRIETVSKWGLRVPQAIYDSVRVDKADNGVVDHDEVGQKAEGFLDVDYGIPVTGGTVTAVGQ